MNKRKIKSIILSRYHGLWRALVIGPRGCRYSGMLTQFRSKAICDAVELMNTLR